MTNDIQSITNLVYSYAELLDTGKFDELGRLFERASVRVHGRPHVAQGIEAIRAMLVGSVRHYDGIPSTKHLVTNLMVEVDPERKSATARCYYVALQACQGLPLQPIIAGRWHDRFERDGDHWCFVERLIYADLIGDLRSHIKGLAT
jgi:hypothetical protein